MRYLTKYWYNKMQKGVMNLTKEENYVYDIIMDCISNHDEERYLCISFDSIMKIIDSYRKNF